MNNWKFRLTLLMLLGLWLSVAMGQATLPATAPASQPTTAPSWAQAQYARWIGDLADPSMEGRRFGSPAAQRAADYIVRQYQAMKLPGAFKGGEYLQPFKTVVGREVVSQSLVLQDVKGKAVLTAKAGDDFRAVPQSGGQVTGVLSFAGYSVVNPARKYDSYAGLAADALKGQVVVLLRYEPQDENGKDLWGALDLSRASIYSKVGLALKHGAAAVLIVNPAGHESDREIRNGPLGSQSTPVMQITRDLFKRMLVAAGESDGDKAMAELQSAADKGAVLKPYKDFKVALELRTQNVVGGSPNVAAVLEGRGKLAGEAILVGGHYDHVGFEMDHGKKVVYCGADDNASGTSGVMLIAKLYSQSLQGDAPRRSVIFVNFTGEEEGLLGSHYMVEHMPDAMLNGKHVVAMINLDMIGRVREGRLWIYGTQSSDGWKAIVDSASKSSPLKIWSGGEADGPSDYASFNAAKIPSVEFFTGMHADVHQPTDTVDKINIPGAVQCVEVALKMLQAAATADQPLAYSGGRHSHAVLGIMPGVGDGKELIVEHVQPDGPAAQAGMKDGDVLLRLQGQGLGDMEQLQAALSKCTPGQQVKCTVRRGADTLDLTVTLGGR